MDVVQRKGDTKAYWEKGMWGDAFVCSVFKRSRFLAINCNLTWLDTSNIAAEPLSSMPVFYTTMVNKIQKKLISCNSQKI